jgi:hypothetical protein
MIQNRPVARSARATGTSSYTSRKGAHCRQPSSDVPMAITAPTARSATPTRNGVRSRP